MFSFAFKTVAGVLLLFIVVGFLRTWQMEHGDNQKLFLKGTVPSPVLSGFYEGVVPGHKFSWVGKKFDDSNNAGINVFDNGSSAQIYKYPFVTSLGKGVKDESLDVLKIDYDISGNPFWLRFVLDEVVETAPGQYLGKLQVRFIWKFPFTLGFFTLKAPGDNFEQGANKTYTEDGSTFQRYWNADLGISFAYKINPDGYNLIEEDVKKVNDKTLEKFFAIVNKKDYEELQNSTIPREGPPQITLLIFKNSENKHVDSWLKDHGFTVNYSANTKLDKVDLGGTSGVRYKAEGLYQDDVLVLENNYHIYVFTGSYNALTDRIHQDFLDFLKTVNLF